MRVWAFLASMALFVFALAGEARADVSPKPECYVSTPGATATISCFVIDASRRLQHWNSATGGWDQVSTLRSFKDSRALSCLQTRDRIRHCFFINGDLFQVSWRDGGPVSFATLTYPSRGTGGGSRDELNHAANGLSCIEYGDNNIVCLVRTAPVGASPGQLYQRRYDARRGSWGDWLLIPGPFEVSDCMSNRASMDYCMLSQRSPRAGDGVLVSRFSSMRYHYWDPAIGGPTITPDRTFGGDFEGPALPPSEIGTNPREQTYPKMTGGPTCLFPMRPSVSRPGTNVLYWQCFVIAQNWFWVGTRDTAGTMAWTRLSIATSDPDPANFGDEAQPACVPLDPNVAPTAPLRLACLFRGGSGARLNFALFDGTRWAPDSGDLIPSDASGAITCLSTPYVAVAGRAPVERMDCFYRGTNAEKTLHRVTIQFGPRFSQTVVNLRGPRLFYGTPPG